MADLASFTSNVSRRTATALSSTVLGGGGGGLLPVRGALVTDGGVYLTTSAGDHISYAQFRPTDSGRLTDNAGNGFVTSGLDNIVYLSI